LNGSGDSLEATPFAWRKRGDVGSEGEKVVAVPGRGEGEGKLLNVRPREKSFPEKVTETNRRPE